MLWIVFLLILVSYVLGSIPFGLVLAKIKGVDLRKVGSGNIGATNAFRALGPMMGVLVFLLDLLKGFLAVFIAKYFTSDPWLLVIVGIVAVLGHLFPIFAKFKGGKGSAVSLGVLLGLAPDMFLLAIICVALIIGITRYVSVASIVTPFIIFGVMFFQDRPLPYLIIVLLAWALIVVRHRENIKRLLDGKENKINFSGSK